MERPSCRRRRPALSCIDCRRRKIKCDRTEPCAHCVASGSQCTYKVYNDPPVAGVLSGPDSLQSPSSPSVSLASGPVQSQQLKVTRPVPGPDIRGHLHFRPNAGVQSTDRHVLGSNDSQPTDTIPSTSAELHGLLRRIEKLEESSLSAKVEGLTETGRSILTGMRGSEVMLKKTRMANWSDWMSNAPEFDPVMACHVNAFVRDGEASSDEAELKATWVEMKELLQKCKNVAKSIKKARPSRGFSTREMPLAPPAREVADAMVALYFQYFESAHRILHVPTFWTEYQIYWDSPATVSAGVRIKILLVIAVGFGMSSGQVVDDAFSDMVHQWIYTAQNWLSGPLEKDRVNINGIQVHCLTILARQIFCVGGDLVWMSMGSLVHRAMQIGLHRDPKYLPTSSLLQAEIRRRLWATILDMVVQTSLDSAMPPRISFDEFDTEAPANINDHEIDDSTELLPVRPRSTFTSTSIQLILYDNLRLRLRVLRLINGLHSELYYPDVLTLSSEITDAYRTCNKFLDENANFGATSFHKCLLEFLLRRFLLPLHCPFASKARTNQLFYYSRKVSLDTAMAMACPEPDEQFSRLLSISGGLFREGMRCALTVITFELISQAEIQHLDGTLERNSQSREILKEVVRNRMAIALERIRQGETNIKAHPYLAMILAWVEALETDSPHQLKIAKSARDSLELCHGLLQARIESSTIPCPDHHSDMPPGTYAGYGEYDIDLDLDLDMDLDFFLPQAETY
ncbi:hypothetical protein LTR84_000916 [Exophiala bonariae]|uniref:Zn(2)-C6 fungal-type domain-containing protein n=1 Tax=Exophiala bonariae TaxID=1690606 RepID=A0AAV9NSH4_9EURO|nr:hypothetical protein LTR84_000916 [Exophiala bonariae]